MVKVATPLLKGQFKVEVQHLLKSAYSHGSKRIFENTEMRY
jgi:hypothetical protein